MLNLAPKLSRSGWPGSDPPSSPLPLPRGFEQHLGMAAIPGNLSLTVGTCRGVVSVDPTSGDQGQGLGKKLAVKSG